MSYNTILATAPLTTQNYHLKMIGTTIGNSLIWDNGTNVGIGNTNTSYTLDVSGTGRFTGITSITSSATSSTTANGALVVTGGLGIGGEANIAGTTIFGTSATPNSKFYIYGGFSVGLNLLQNYSGSAYTTEEHRASDYSYKIGTTAAMTITSAGNVGIGRTDPTRLLDVSALGTAYIRASDRTNSVNVDMLAASSGGWIGTQTTHAFMIQTDNTERMRIRADGSISFSTTAFLTTDNNTITPYSGNGYLYIMGGSTGLALTGSGDRNNAIYINTSTNTTSFYTNNVSRMSITSGGYIKQSNTGSYGSATSSSNEFNSNVADWTVVLRNTQASNPYGFYTEYVNASPNNAANEFIYCRDSSAVRFRVASNGNAYNSTGVYTSGASDIRYKEQVIDANSQWDDIKNLRVVNFKFIKDVEQNGDNALRHIGFIAQEVEKVSPNLVEEMTDKETGETWKTIKASIIHTKAIKALQEAMTKIEEQQIQIQNLQEQINILAK